MALTICIAPDDNLTYHADEASASNKPMSERLTLNQTHLQTFITCPRRFRLRYLDRMPWPEAPLGPEQELAYARGRLFHRWLERHFLQLAAEDDAASDPVVRYWWSVFRSQGPDIPAGERLAELSLTVPAGNFLLSGRFDLLVLGEGADGQPTATLFDWKSGEPRQPDWLRRHWQTRLYLALLAEGGAALPGNSARGIAPEDISMIYWYATDPSNPVVIAYDSVTHSQNWSEIMGVLDAIEDQLEIGEWPLTDDWSDCRYCPYQAYCGRQAAGQSLPDQDEDDEPSTDDVDWLEPAWN